MGKKDKGKSKARDKARGKAGKKDARRSGRPARGQDPLASPELVFATGAPRLESEPGRPTDLIEASELAARLASLGPILQRQLAAADQPEGLTRSRLSALSRLVLGGPRTLGELATAERVRPPTMTRLVRAMGSDGLVTRERHPDDARSIIIRATAHGERRLDEARSRQLLPLADAISDLDEAERRQLESAADLLGRLLREASREPSEPAE